MGEAPRVLVVEDEASIAQVIVDVLEAEGYAVRLAEHGAETLAILQTWTPDLIVLDLMMPVMDGTAFRAAQRGLDPPLAAIPVLVLSGAREARTRAAELGVAVALTKPFEIEELPACVRQLVGRRADP